jgi:hypothetical protein
MANAHIAKLMWDAYAFRAGGKTFDGKPLPTWDGLGDERQYCWTGVAEVCANRIEKLEAALARIAKYDLQAIAMDALRPGERIRETLNTSSECVNETGES